MSAPSEATPIAVDGAYHGDGCIRMTAPLSPAIHLGAEKVLAIGIRYFRPANNGKNLDQQTERNEHATAECHPIDFADFFCAQIEQHDDEQEQHHDRARVNENLDDADEKCV